jgi:chromosome segregation ATPase
MSEDLTKKLPTGDNNVAIILQNIDSRLERLEQKVEERLHDTRPIWEKVVADIAQLQEGQRQLQEGQRQLQEGQTRLEADVHDTKISMREIKWQIGEIAESYVQVKGRARELEGRVRELEQHHKPTNSST